MQIKSLRIDDNLCLVDFTIHFQIVNGGSSTILIGENGTGKSTMMDTLLEIFTSFDSPAVEKRMGYNYEIEYDYAQKSHVITKDGHDYSIQIEDRKYEGNYSAVRHYLKEKRVFPQRIIVFYSGANNKSEERIRRMNNRYASMCQKTMRTFLESMSDDSSNDIPYFPKRKYNYCDEALTPIYLLAIMQEKASFEKKYLQDNCHVSSIEYVDVSVNLDKVERLFGNSRFDDEYPTNLFYILDFIDSRFTDLFRQGFLYSSYGKGYFEIMHIEKTNADPVAVLELFEKLHTLFDAKIDVSVTIGNTAVKISNMSEGQRQLIKVLGMLGICKNEDCLVLMDEPDVHMNPAWKYEIKTVIDKCSETAINTLAIIATHDPLVVNGVSKEFIRIFSYNKAVMNNNGFYFTKVIVPQEDTEGLGIDGLLQSEYYGLPTVLDIETKNKLYRKNELLIKKAEKTLSDQEKQDLVILSNELENMTFARNIPTDEYYDEYVAAMHKIYRDNLGTKLTAEEIVERNETAKKIVQELLEK